MNAAEILKRMAQRYAQCSTYHDVGTIAYQPLRFTEEEVDEVVEFRIRFARRPSELQFESMRRDPLSGELQPVSVRCSDTSIQIWSCGRQKQHTDLRDALAYVHLITAPSPAEVLAPLLMPELQDGWRGDGLMPDRAPHLLKIKDLSFAGEEMRNGLNCFVLNGSLTRLKETTVWISARDFSIVRLYTVLGTAEEANQRDKATELREAELAAKLGRPAVAVEAYAHRDYFVDYQFTQTRFDEPIDV